MENEKTSQGTERTGRKEYPAAEELEENQKAHEQTKVEYDRLEEELEQLNSQMDQLWKRPRIKASAGSSWMARSRYFREQILAGVQNEEHYKTRLQTIEADRRKRRSFPGEPGRGEIPAPCSSSGGKEAPGGRGGPAFQYTGAD